MLTFEIVFKSGTDVEAVMEDLNASGSVYGDEQLDGLTFNLECYDEDYDQLTDLLEENPNVASFRMV